MTNRQPNLTSSYYFPGQHAYHTRSGCSNYGMSDPAKVSLIELSRSDLVPCQKCRPPEKPVEFAVCGNCGWESPADECDRDRGYKGACPSCGSAATSSEFRAVGSD